MTVGLINNQTSQPYSVLIRGFGGGETNRQLNLPWHVLRVEDRDYGKPYDAGLIIINRFDFLGDGVGQDSKH